jgi:transporter family protein
MSWLLYALLSAGFAGLVGILGKVGVAEVDSTTATGVRAFVMALVMALTMTVLGSWGKVGTITARPLLFIVLSGTAGALSWICYFKALQLGQAAQVAPIDRLSGVITLVLAVLFLHEKVSAYTVAGSVLMVVGGLLVARG